ncbi:hypothetical protein [Antarcticimicrobium luteum]|uniref:hypothetical protein n=1 Tax=Antarcticimicrobium luteum TaxID=2547397 RepID=UPI00140C6448|nr:hypothetical protein [Antarcticimicrobium luteum]
MIAWIATGAKMRKSLVILFDLLESRRRGMSFMKHVDLNFGNTHGSEPFAFGSEPTCGIAT